MKFAIITHVIHQKQGNAYFAYAPYIREMNVWGKYVTQFLVVGALEEKEPTAIESSYDHKKITFFQIDAIDVLTWQSILSTFFALPRIVWQIFKAMFQADHIHLRCPGNIGLIGCLVQILFPFKPKTAKYAGNWDPKAQQPWSYRVQKWLLRNTFLTRNMQVLVYGEWEGSTKNILPFFTASYSINDQKPLACLRLNEKIKFVYVGTLSSGKNPMYAVHLVASLHQRGYDVALELFGEGEQRTRLAHYIHVNHLNDVVKIQGNQNIAMVTSSYKTSHFVLLPSQSEGWPKAIAEGMFWGCIPVATPISCLPFMLDNGERGILLDLDLTKDVAKLEAIINSPSLFDAIRGKASAWSRNYTLESFESEIKKLLY
ncbi:glycosyltransferase family 4 protein [Flavobacterium sp. TSSA_36]|uniref:glycosyltransferase family 4 protein n=1 Tax=Flavobacterium sp. TSSA_36 TaxID=3447669 RepID=UPI003F2DC27F